MLKRAENLYIMGRIVKIFNEIYLGDDLEMLAIRPSTTFYM